VGNQSVWVMDIESDIMGGKFGENAEEKTTYKLKLFG
jgi:hypothetical protein